MTVQVEVSEGQVLLSQIHYAIDEPTMKVIHVETESKRFEVFGASFNTKHHTVEEITLLPSEGSRYVDNNTHEQTRIRLSWDRELHGGDTQWQIFYDTQGRYGFDIIMYQIPSRGTRKILWKSERD